MAPETASAAPSPAEARRALGELRLRQAQVLAERRRRDPRWATALGTALALTSIGARSLDGWRHQRRLRYAIGGASVVAGLPWSGAAGADLWLGDPAAFGDEQAWKRAEAAPVLGLMRTSCGSVGALLAVVALSRIAIARLRARGVRMLWIADCLVLLLSRLAAARARRTSEAALERAAREVAAAELRAVDAPSPAPQLADLADFSIAALLLPARAAREEMLAAAIPLDRVVLADRLAALTRAGLVERERRGRLRPRRWLSLTPRGRELATAHVAALQARARSV
ncbi:hypothetical protein [Conexibacter arvalis]|uniref:DNA-binding transcriptional ArsR family regulator n=1 Tax=Conexibacter arvalis TaxID=912552 RepID=A0A840IAJ4_9ACTN|nr:hypothetical protein [Conexibacter arvalis]MBB4661856.1 DNA-binding transcriptional ArsR family regulator [Conexibacter arvalis]